MCLTRCGPRSCYVTPPPEVGGFETRRHGGKTSIGVTGCRRTGEKSRLSFRKSRETQLDYPESINTDPIKESKSYSRRGAEKGLIFRDPSSSSNVMTTPRQVKGIKGIGRNTRGSSNVQCLTWKDCHYEDLNRRCSHEAIWRSDNLNIYGTQKMGSDHSSEQ